MNIAPWIEGFLIRTEMRFDGLHDLFKSRDLNTLEEAGKQGYSEVNSQIH